MAGQSILAEEVQYFPVSMAKLVFMSVVTFGIYELYWAYKNWQYIKQRDQSNIWPFWRAVFAPFWYFSIIEDINDKGANTENKKDLSVLLAVGYLLLMISWRLPDPYSLVSTLSFLMLIPCAKRINDLNQGCPGTLAANSRVRVWQVPIILVLVPLLGFTVATALNFMPNVQVVPGERMWSWQVDGLRERGVLESDEQIMYFYSDAFWSIYGDGNVVTDQGLVSYFLDPSTDEFYSASAKYADIDDIVVDFREGFVENSIVTVQLKDGSEFQLLVNNDGDLDHVFVDAIRDRLR